MRCDVMSLYYETSMHTTAGRGHVQCDNDRSGKGFVFNVDQAFYHSPLHRVVPCADSSM